MAELVWKIGSFSLRKQGWVSFKPQCQGTTRSLESLGYPSILVVEWTLGREKNRWTFEDVENSVVQLKMYFTKSCFKGLLRWVIRFLILFKISLIPFHFDCNLYLRLSFRLSYVYILRTWGQDPCNSMVLPSFLSFIKRTKVQIPLSSLVTIELLKNIMRTWGSSSILIKLYYLYKKKHYTLLASA